MTGSVGIVSAHASGLGRTLEEPLPEAGWVGLRQDFPPVEAHQGTLQSQGLDPVFVERIFGSLPRTDQRRWAHTYLQSLLSTPGKKALRRLAATVSDSPTAYQSLHQFVNGSRWDWTPVRGELMRWAEQRVEPRAWTIEVAMLRKRGEHSCGVHRRFVPATGRSVTCQMGIGAFLASDREAIPVDWRLLLPGAWTKDPERRSRARIPDEPGPQTLEEHILDLVDGLADNTNTAVLPVVSDLSEQTGVGAVVVGLSMRGRDFVISVPDSLQVLPGSHLRQPPYSGEGPMATMGVRRFLELENNTHTRLEMVPSFNGSARHTAVLSSLVRLPRMHPAGPQLNRTYRLFALRPSNTRRPAQLWLSSMLHWRTADLISLAKVSSRAQESVVAMENDLGLLDFEGRSFPGWHHHMTMVSAGYAYSRLNGPVPAPVPMPLTA
jgi:hypothetical protein